jgi:hypothetical protein
MGNRAASDGRWSCKEKTLLPSATIGDSRVSLLQAEGRFCSQKRAFLLPAEDTASSVGSRGYKERAVVLVQAESTVVGDATRPRWLRYYKYFCYNHFIVLLQ